MGKIKILFRIGYVYHKAAFDPVIDLYLDDPEYDVWFSLDMEKKRFILFDYSYRPLIMDEWIRSGYRFADSEEGFDIVITGDTLRNSNRYGRTMLCFLNHGTGIKNILYRNLARVPGDKYQIFVEGQHRVNSLMNSPSLGMNEVHLIGLPKLDYFFQNRYQREAVLSRWGLDPNRKTVLFAPTYKPTCLYDVRDDIFIQTRDYNLIIKLHPYSWMGKYAPHKQHRIYERRISKFKHAVLLPFDEYNIVPYYVAADTIISEASSTIFDFLALQKTGIIFNLQSDSLLHSDGQPLLEIDNREFLKDAFVHIDGSKQIGKAVERALQPTHDMLEAQKKYRDHLFYKLDGGASVRFKEKVRSLYEEGGHENVPR